MKNNSVALLLSLLIALAGLAGSFFVGMRVGADSVPTMANTTVVLNAEIGKPDAVDFSPFWRAWNLIDERFAGEGPTNEEKLWGAIRGLADSLGDPYTVFFTPEELELFNEGLRGDFEGVGMEVGMRDGNLTVIAPLKGTPAERAGVRAGDRILLINDTPTGPLRLDEAVLLIRGEKGTTVVLTVARAGVSEPIEITITRDVIEVPTLEIDVETGNDAAAQGEEETERERLREDGVFVIRLFSFAGNSAQQFRSALRDFVNSGSDKLLIDLRGNPGGFLESAVDMASWFLPPGKVVVRQEGTSEEQAIVHRSKGYNIFNDELRVAILIDRGSASASEILAGALREHGVATLVGQPTFGKGSVQELVDITGDTSLKLTIARWFTPEGVSISENGLTPDIAVEMTPEDIETGRDPQFNRAVDYLVTER